MPNRIGFPSIGISVEHDALLLAIDDSLLPLKKNLCFYLSKPDVRPEPVMVPSRDNPLAPDYLASHFYGTVLLEDGKYRMWYYSVAHGEAEGDLSQGPVCYAESDDGLTWVKPSLGQVTIRGSSDNNAIALTDERIEGVTLIRDDADPDPQRRYKMIYNYWQEDGAGHYFTIRTAISADGITWQPGPPSPIDEFSEQASFYAYDGLYIVNGQSGSAPQRSEGGAPRGRHGFAWISPDFNDWLAESAESFTLPEPADPEKRGITKEYDQVHLGTGAASFGNVLVGLYCIWHNFDQTDHWFGFGKISGDFGLVVSNDGLRFREPVKGHVYLGSTAIAGDARRRQSVPDDPVPGQRHPERRRRDANISRALAQRSLRRRLLRRGGACHAAARSLGRGRPVSQRRQRLGLVGADRVAGGRLQHHAQRRRRRRHAPGIFRRAFSADRRLFGSGERP